MWGTPADRAENQLRLILHASRQSTPAPDPAWLPAQSLHALHACTDRACEASRRALSAARSRARAATVTGDNSMRGLFTPHAGFVVHEWHNVRAAVGGDLPEWAPLRPAPCAVVTTLCAASTVDVWICLERARPEHCNLRRDYVAWIEGMLRDVGGANVRLVCGERSARG